MGEMPGPLLGIDYGLERTGLAIAETGIAMPLGVLAMANFNNRGALFDEIAKIATEKSCAAIIMGLPLHVDGSENSFCGTVRKAALRIKRRAMLPLYFMPETLSSEQAQANLREARIPPLKIKQFIDQEAARIILQSWLDARARENP